MIINIAIDTHLIIASLFPLLDTCEHGIIDKKISVILYKVDTNSYNDLVNKLAAIGYLSKKVINVVTDTGNYTSWYYYKD